LNGLHLIAFRNCASWLAAVMTNPATSAMMNVQATAGRRIDREYGRINYQWIWVDRKHGRRFSGSQSPEAFRLNHLTEEWAGSHHFLEEKT
jgi:hypothetical protein